MWVRERQKWAEIHWPIVRPVRRILAHVEFLSSAAEPESNRNHLMNSEQVIEYLRTANLSADVLRGLADVSMDSNFSDAVISLSNEVQLREVERHEPHVAPDLTDAQHTLIELDRRKAAITEFYERYEKALAAVVAESGVGCHFQDDEGVVYQLVEPEGRFVYFEKYRANRTRRDEEKAGTLSMTKARELGYEVEGK